VDVLRGGGHQQPGLSAFAVITQIIVVPLFGLFATLSESFLIGGLDSLMSPIE
jgi:hypothetical protein